MHRLDVDLVEADRGLIAEWSQLSSATGARFYSRPEWFIPWATAFNGGSLHCLTARQKSQLVALMPVIPDGHVVRAAVNSETRCFSPLLAESVDLIQVINALPSRWRRLSFAYLPAGMLGSSGASNQLEKRQFITQELRRSPFLSTVGEFSAWEKARLPASHRATMRRRQRRLSERGDLCFEVRDGKEGLTELLDEAFALEGSGWKGQAGTAILSRPDVHSFYRAFLSMAVELRILRVFFLRLNRAPIAVQLAIEDQEEMSGLKIAFDEQYRACSPGVLISRAVLQYCFESPAIRRFDFHGEAEKAKLEWTDDTETQVRAEIFSTGVQASIERAVVRTAWDARNSIRRRVPVEVRERVDTSSPVATVRSLARLGLSAWRRSTPRLGVSETHPSGPEPVS